jgi:hypothetical protein
MINRSGSITAAFQAEDAVFKTTILCHGRVAFKSRKLSFRPTSCLANRLRKSIFRPGICLISGYFLLDLLARPLYISKSSKKNR